MCLKWASFFICCYCITSTVGIETHSLKFLSTWRSNPGENQPQFEQVTVSDGVIVSYCDSKTFREEPRQSAKSSTTLFEDCSPAYMDNDLFWKELTPNISSTVDVVQRERGCTWNTDGLGSSFEAWAVNGMDFLTFDPYSLRWRAQSTEAIQVQSSWNAKQLMNSALANLIKNDCPLIILRTKSIKSRSTGLRVFAKPVPNKRKLSLRCHVTTFDLSISKVILIGDGAAAANHVTVTQPLPGGDGLIIIRLTAEISIDTDKKYGCMVQTKDHNTSVIWDGKTLDGRSINIHTVKQISWGIIFGTFGPCTFAAITLFLCYVEVFRLKRDKLTSRAAEPFKKEEFEQMISSESSLSVDRKMALITMYFRGNIPKKYKYIEEQWLEMMTLREREHNDPDFCGPDSLNSRDTWF